MCSQRFLLLLLPILTPVCLSAAACDGTAGVNVSERFTTLEVNLFIQPVVRPILKVILLMVMQPKGGAKSL